MRQRLLRAVSGLPDDQRRIACNGLNHTATMATMATNAGSLFSPSLNQVPRFKLIQIKEAVLMD